MAKTISRYISDEDLARATVALGPSGGFVFRFDVSEDDGDGAVSRERSVGLTAAQVVAIGGFTQAQVTSFRNQLTVLLTKMREGSELDPPV